MLRMYMKISLHPFLKNKEIGTGRILIIRYYKISHITAAYHVQDILLSVSGIWTGLVFLKAFILTGTAWLKTEFTKPIYFYRIMHDRKEFGYLLAVALFSRAK